jgi:hypothetical protein
MCLLTRSLLRPSLQGFTRDFNTSINVPHPVVGPGGAPLLVTAGGREWQVHIMSGPHKQVRAFRV